MDLNKNSYTPEDFLNLQLVLLKKKKISGKVITGSMLPLIPIGSIIDITPIKISELKKFDIIVFYQHKVLICHYVWHFSKWNSNQVVTRSLVGGEDIPLDESEILGLVENFKISKWTRFKILSARLFRPRT